MTLPCIDKYRQEARDTGQEEEKISIESILEEFEVKQEYVDKLGEEEFLYDDLIISLHILVLIASSGGGKTTFLFFHVAAQLAKKGCTVWYIDADSPASDHRKMKAFADEHGFHFLIPDVNIGTSVDTLKQKITALANSKQDLSGYVFFFDTLKKFIDLMAKKSAKDFFVLMRKLTKLGATVVLPGHANKHRDSDGNLVFEGVGDVRSDTDDLIFFEKTKRADGSIDVTTVVDTDKGAKVRGIFKPFSFHIDQDRNVSIYDNAIPMVDLSNTGVPKATDEEILITAEQYLKSCDEPVSQKQLVQYVADKIEGEAGLQRIRKLVVQRAVKDGDHQLAGTRFVYTVKDRNAHFYELPKQEKKQRKMWEVDEPSFTT